MEGVSRMTYQSSYFAQEDETLVIRADEMGDGNIALTFATKGGYASMNLTQKGARELADRLQTVLRDIDLPEVSVVPDKNAGCACGGGACVCGACDNGGGTGSTGGFAGQADGGQSGTTVGRIARTDWVDAVGRTDFESGEMPSTSQSITGFPGSYTELR